MDRATEQAVRRRASGRCEYCRVPEATSPLKHVLDHIIARQHGGGDELENLALCCGRCNQFKGPNLAGIDPAGGAMVRLFHPRKDLWHEHFVYDGAELVGLTEVGRTTIATLAINLPIRVAVRQALIDSGISL